MALVLQKEAVRIWSWFENAGREAADLCAAAFEEDVEELDGIDSDGPELGLGGFVQQPWEV